MFSSAFPPSATSSPGSCESPLSAREERFRFPLLMRRFLYDGIEGAYGNAHTAFSTETAIDARFSLNNMYGCGRAGIGAYAAAVTQCFFDVHHALSPSLLQTPPSEHGGVSQRSSFPQQVFPLAPRPPIRIAAGTESILSRSSEPH
jgi:hypothetical protein